MTQNDNRTDLIGYTGGIILSICLIPQIYRIIQTKEVENISLLWQLLYLTGIGLHLYYAIYYDLLPIYIPTIIELCMILFLLVLKIIYRRSNKIVDKNNNIELNTIKENNIYEIIPKKGERFQI